MSRPAISIQSNGGWTFGSPSVLMMFHRDIGSLDQELKEMNECVPLLLQDYQWTWAGCGNVMAAEAKYMQDIWWIHRTGAVYSHIEGNNQENIRLCYRFSCIRAGSFGRLFSQADHRAKTEEILKGIIQHG